MPKINIATSTKLTPQDAFGKIKEFFAHDRDLRKFDSNYQCQFDDSRLTGRAKGTKFDAEVSVHADPGGSKIDIAINIPLMLSPFKGFVEKTIQDKIRALIG
jgi:hypothetical protein